jgi:dTDP-glucose 4,6-dehydratase
MKGEPIKVKDGTPYRSYLYAADLAIWLWTILFKGEACHPYNVGSDQEITISQLAEVVASALGGGETFTSRSISTVDSPAVRYVPSIQKAQTELGLQQRTPLETSLLRTAKWASMTPS